MQFGEVALIINDKFDKKIFDKFKNQDIMKLADTYQKPKLK